MREDAFFFYGTLMDRDLLSAVLGRRVWPRSLAPAVLRGYRRSGVRGASYPIVLRKPRASVEGVILNVFGIAERDRLCAYEGEGYQLTCALAELPRRGLRPVFLFRPRRGAYSASRRLWSLAGWRLGHKRSVLKGLAVRRGERMQR